MITSPCKVSQLTLEIVMNYMKIEPDSIDEMEKTFLQMCMASAIDYIKGYTNLPIEEIDFFDSMTIACLLLISDYYETRAVNIESSKVNRMLTHILSMNRDLE